MNSWGSRSKREAPSATSKNKSSTALPVFLLICHSASPPPSPSLFSDPTGKDLVPKPAGEGAQSEQEEATAAAAAFTAAPASPRRHRHSSGATPGGPVPQLCQPPGHLLPNACQGGVPAVAARPGLWAGGLEDSGARNVAPVGAQEA